VRSIKVRSTAADTSVIRWMLVIGAGATGFLVGGAAPAAVCLVGVHAAVRLRRFVRSHA
jgi:hypothetical protein